MSENEGAKFWLSILIELKNRGIKDVFMACVDGLTGFPEAIAAAFPKTQVQLCIVHRVPNSLRFVSWKDRKEAAASLKTICPSITVTGAGQDLEETMGWQISLDQPLLAQSQGQFNRVL